MTRSRSLHIPLTALVAGAVALAACGGSSNSTPTDSTPATTMGAADDTPDTDTPDTDPPDTAPPDTAPPVTDPPVTDPPATDPPATDAPPTSDEPPTTDFVLGSDTVLQEFGGGFLKMDVWPGWEVSDASDAPFAIFDSVTPDPWAYDIDAAETVVELSSGDAIFGILRERRYGAVESYSAYLAGMIEAISEVTGVQIQGPDDWAGLDGDYTSFQGGLSVRTGHVDGQFVSAVTLGIETEELADQVRAMLDNVRFDASVIGPLDHSIDMLFESDATGSEIAASVLVPFDWVQNLDSDSLEYSDPLTGATASITLTPSQGGIDAMADVVESTDLLAPGPTREDLSSNGLDYAVLWDGGPRDAHKAIIVADDGSYGVAILVDTAEMLLGEEPFGDRLIDHIVGSVYFPVHAQL